MQSPVNPSIEAFKKAFPIHTNVHVEIDSVTYNKQTYRIEDTVKQARDFIFKERLPLEVTYNKIMHCITVSVISEFDRIDNSLGEASKRLTELQKQLN